MKFSIIIPVYNVAPYLKECLDSVVAAAECFSRVERGGRVEIVCVDDGSTDGSSEILDSYLQLSLKTPTLKVIHKTNGGVSSARNRGLEEARGEWILFLDGDDLIDSDLLTRLVEIADKNEAIDMMGFGLRTFDDDGRVVEHEVHDLFGTSFVQYAYRKDIVGELRFPSLTIGEDRVFVVRCLRRAKRIATIPGTSYAYRLRSGSAIRGKWSFRKRWDNFRHAIILLGLIFVTPQANRRWVLRYVRRVFDTGVALFTGKVK